MNVVEHLKVFKNMTLRSYLEKVTYSLPLWYEIFVIATCTPLEPYKIEIFTNVK